MSQVKYEDFEEYLFGRHTEDQAKWFDRDDFVEKVFDNTEVVLFASDIYNNISKISLNYSGLQICHGLEYLINSASGFVCYAFLDKSVDENLRLISIKNMRNVFDAIFSEKCNTALGHLSNTQLSCYNYLCYMWWDIFPRHGVPKDNHFFKTDNVIIELLEYILSLENIACKESALHGLGHWHVGYPDIVKNIIQKAQPALPEVLKNYAEQAMSGSVQ